MIRTRMFEYFHTYDQTKTNDLYKYLLYILRRISFFFFSLLILYFFRFSLFCTTNKREDPFILYSITSYKYNNTDVFLHNLCDTSKQSRKKLSIFSTLSLLNYNSNVTSFLPHFEFMNFKSKIITIILTMR